MELMGTLNWMGWQTEAHGNNEKGTNGYGWAESCAMLKDVASHMKWGLRLPTFESCQAAASIHTPATSQGKVVFEKIYILPVVTTTVFPVFPITTLYCAGQCCLPARASNASFQQS
jgi:hypothetical protein